MRRESTVTVEPAAAAADAEVGELKRQLDEAHKTMWALYKELDDKNAALNRSNHELEQFATIASHDLQEPLRKVVAFARLLREEYGEALEEGGIDYLGRMEGACERMLALIGDLLRFARVTSRARPFEPTDLGAVAAEVVSDLEDQVAREGAIVAVAPLPVIDADPVQMRQLLQNLISNGLKFRHRDRPPRVEVSAALAQGGRAELRVTDNGIGLNPKFAERIFQPFRRLHGQGRYEGTGMGLAIVRKIAERHGGEARVESEPGKGSRFVVSLPRRQEEVAAFARAPRNG
jgi:light-regulated signal transduction histidine kinase (bacteriophytochrome)